MAYEETWELLCLAQDRIALASACIGQLRSAATVGVGEAKARCMKGRADIDEVLFSL